MHHPAFVAPVLEIVQNNGQHEHCIHVGTVYGLFCSLVPISELNMVHVCSSPYYVQNSNLTC